MDQGKLDVVKNEIKHYDLLGAVNAKAKDRQYDGLMQR
ncbi:hypothetical protein T11_12351 [Trichinella zimbabwensis]|uniref:Uncharacterized protein n=1 Tax=Trichinella zimbabwensis TaxID=268475 RepID=A0A0V1G9T0_9BILA|nr:hypothetical protein T11_12351 [Trichinella zimbabwensis]